MLTATWTDGVSAAPLPEPDASPGPWTRAALVAEYERIATVIALRGEALVGLWRVPLTTEGGVVHARRELRLTPYCAPWLASDHPQRRRHVVIAMLQLLQERVESIDLPMAPGFVEVTGALETGVDVTWRHTRMLLRDPDWRLRYSPKARNHVRAGRASTTIRIDWSPEPFDFDRGVTTQSAARRRFAGVLHRHLSICCLTAVARRGSKAGQVLMAADDHTSYLLHSWFDRSGPRGVTSALVDAALCVAFEDLGVEQFDFEGSVLPSVDEFMSGFGAEASPYPQLRWSVSGRMPSTLG
jgi:hypothetical protein